MLPTGESFRALIRAIAAVPMPPPPEPDPWRDDASAAAKPHRRNPRVAEQRKMSAAQRDEAVLLLRQLPHASYSAIAERCSLEAETVRKLAARYGLCRGWHGVRWTDEERQRVIELRRSGMSCSAIAKKIGRSAESVQRQMQRMTP